MKRHPNEQKAIQEIVALHGSLRKAAKHFGTTAAYLSQVEKGHSRLSEKIASKIGWEWQLVKKQNIEKQ